ncbi:hypothetical protein MKS88_004373 [Plasmodium brasilianum]|uniref:Uncharacterized protein n=2 Tax=Plasmodium (Plasmodium) TaxID=418103 RepID=A0A1A8W8E5_PLAMA|nr:conserved Plasmodium protein, unknown function [Plasmodium malariae]KAI4836575.1 hypothetical protein MKS88_004373 [Plasmodium brasilianum]SBS88243.1 conserved Plasmodium protein, unknown function [Plasmodium malariae]SBT80218.1 conserved Plasmodium protein, unknown function [Plasmodium malariae]SCO93847.1 conserved Plasmodium protein, unknown function [Plasmodium malariae]
MSQCVWELISIEKSFAKERDNYEIHPVNNFSKNYEFHNLDNIEIRTDKVDYDYAEDLSKYSKIKNEKNKLKFEKIMHKFFISDISKYVNAYVKKSDSNILSEIGITSSKKIKLQEERYWVNSYIYNFISHCLNTYYDCKHYIVISRSKNLIQKLTGTGYGYYGIYFTNGKKIGGLGNLFINIKQVRHISYSIMKTLQTKTASDRSVSNNDETCSFIFML